MRMKKSVLGLSGVIVCAVGILSCKPSKKDSDSSESVGKEEPSANQEPSRFNSQEEQVSRSETVNDLVALMRGRKHSDDRVVEIKNLCSEQAAEVLPEIFALFAGDRPEGVGNTVWWLVANEVMEIHRKCQTEGLSEHLVGLLKNKEADPILRDYAAQHYILEQCRLILDQSAVLESKTKVVNEVLGQIEEIFHGVESYDQTLYGTSLMALSHFADCMRKDEVFFSQIRNSAEPLIASLLKEESKVKTANRTAAIQVAGNLRIKKFANQIAQIAWNEDQPYPMRISAIGVLRYFPEFADREKLHNLSQKKKFKATASSTLNHL